MEELKLEVEILLVEFGDVLREIISIRIAGGTRMMTYLLHLAHAHAFGCRGIPPTKGAGASGMRMIPIVPRRWQYR